MTLREIAAWLGGTVVGRDDIEILRPAKIEEAGEGSITFLANPKYARFLAKTGASAVLVGPSLDLGSVSHPALSFVIVPDPYVAFLRILERLVPSPDPFYRGVHSTAVIAPSAKLGEGVSVGPLSSVADGVTVGAGTTIGAGVMVGKGVAIGSQCVLYDRATVYHGCRLGDRVVVHSGTVVGSDGFGFAPRPDGSYEKIPQLGIVRIEDDCEIGANCTIDRATIGETVIRRGAKIDNLVQVAHNVVIGEHTVIAAQTGISGSSKIGSYCRIAGQVGISGHVEIADRTTLLGQTGVSKSITEPGKTWFGTPQREHVRSGRIEAVLRHLPELRIEVDDLRRKLDDILRTITK
ncbi:MAG: UDP-3-O-(3-hydroxymyristoyl)glucosamine N-acyltransferase [Bacteroidetes bacterium]|nr:UDP-3-O-(3-hydroxymyristoyl)glucosamine N-acyltransferase [Bacteroidota bacterium]